MLNVTRLGRHKLQTLQRSRNGGLYFVFIHNKYENLLISEFRNCFPNGSQHKSLPGILLSIMLFVDSYKVLIPVF